VQRRTGIPYALFDGRIESTAATLRALGRLMGNEREAELLAAWYENALTEVRQRSGKATFHPLVYYGRGGAGLQTAGKGSITVEVLDVLGARNAAAEARAGLVTVSFEQVILWDPEVILTTDPNYWASVWTDARWRAVKAVAAKRVYLSPHLPFGWFDFPPGPNRIVGLFWLANILYPDVFKDDLRKRVSEFYQLFYHREPTAAQLNALLSMPGVPPR
jgi:iron complex transport system substrate-binding protein